MASKSLKPNIIVFFTDQQRWDTCGIQGNPLDLTPEYDRMARAGTHFSTACTMQPVCGPARSCLQTGVHASVNGCYRNGIALDPSLPNLAGCFREAGYETAYIGKWHLAPGDHVGAVPAEFRGNYKRWLAANVLEFTSDAYQTRLWDENNRAVDLPGYRVDALTDAAIRLLAEPRDKPLFLFLSFLEPHHQNHTDSYPAPRGYAGRYQARWTPPDLAALGGSAPQHLAGYCGMVKRLDEALGRIRDALYSLGMEDQTVLAYTSDHGCHFKTRNAEYKRTCHEASIRVPLAFHGPGFSGGGQHPDPVSLIDLPPTLLDAAGIQAPDTMQGRSLLGRLRGELPPARGSVFGQTSEAEVGRFVRTRRWKYGVFAPDANPRETGSAPAYLERFLYDLDHDPYELDNLIELPSHRALADSLQADLLQWIFEIEGERPDISNADTRPSAGQRLVDLQPPE